MKWFFGLALTLVLLTGIALMAAMVYFTFIVGVNATAAGFPGFLLIVGSIFGFATLHENELGS